MSAAAQPEAQRSIAPALLRRANGIVAATASILLASSALVTAAPAIRANASNPVPACVTPDRLMAFLTARNPDVDPRFANIANYYRQWGEAWRVRWDYAFFQMAIETNYLKYRRGDGSRGDVRETQNNFAGIGATGRGAPGDRFADVSTGVHAQIQHLVAYSGERLARPIAPRTTLKQDDIVEESLRLNRPVTFGDLARRWAVDRRYANSIDFVAGQYREAYCRDGATAADMPAPPTPQPAQRRRAFPPPSGLGGPKPSALAGPATENTTAQTAEVLPWATTPVETAKPVERTPPAAAAKAKVKPPAANAGPVRTIWSRSTAPAETEHQQGRPGEIAAVAAPAQARAIASVPPTPPAPTDDGGFFLPLFRIAPSGPSRLGGPLPGLHAMAGTQLPIDPPADKPASPKSAGVPCRVLKATYGGKKTLLVRSTIDGQVRLTALTVLDGFEKSMFETYARAAAPGAEIIGEYENQAAALADARSNCPGG